MATKTATYTVGQTVYKAGKHYGTVKEVRQDGGGMLIVTLGKPRYTGSDQRDDAGIAVGTKMAEGIVCFVQIAQDGVCRGPKQFTVEG